MKKNPRFPLSARVAAALGRLHKQARNLVRVYGYRPEKHYMRGPGPRASAKNTRPKTKATNKPQLPAQ